MAEPQYPPPSSGAPYHPYTPPDPTRQLPANPYGYSAPPASGPPGSMIPYSPVAPPVYAPVEQVIAQIGDIQVTSTTVRTPVGQFPLRGSQWSVTDAWTVSQKTPGWAIALAVIGFFCVTFFSLLFLLAKETVVTGMLQVQVSNGPQVYVTRIPVNNQAVVQGIYAQVNYVRALAAM